MCCACVCACEWERERKRKRKGGRACQLLHEYEIWIKLTETTDIPLFNYWSTIFTIVEVLSIQSHSNHTLDLYAHGPTFHSKQTRPTFPKHPTNVIWYGRILSVESARLLVLLLLFWPKCTDVQFTCFMTTLCRTVLTILVRIAQKLRRFC